MKTTTFLNNIGIVYFAISCFSCHQPKDNLPSLDLSKNYPEKEILLTDIADVTYLHINANDEEYLYSGSIRAVTENTIIIFDWGRSSGEIFFFTIDGIPMSHFNRMGNGPGEYRNIHRVIYDEKADDLFVVDYWNTIIQVFSSTGRYKREIDLPDGARMGNDFVSFDNESLFFYDTSREAERFDMNYKNLPANILFSPFYLISKTDGAVLDHIELPMAPLFLGIYLNGEPVPARSKIRMIKCADGVLLCNPESDTVFLYGKDRSLTPVLHKIPPADATNPMTYLNNMVDMGSYQFMEVYTVQAGAIYPGIFPVKYYMRNKKTGEIFQQKLLLPEYSGKEFTISPAQTRLVLENSIYFELDLLELKEAYTQNRLSGKLKELVAILKEDDNNVYVIAKFK